MNLIPFELDNNLLVEVKAEFLGILNKPFITPSPDYNYKISLAVADKTAEVKYIHCNEAIEMSDAESVLMEITIHSLMADISVEGYIKNVCGGNDTILNREDWVLGQLYLMALKELGVYNRLKTLAKKYSR